MIKLPPDWTFLAQLLSFLVFWQFMKWALFGPVQRVLEARAARITGSRTRAETLQAEAAALAAEINAELNEGRRAGAREAEEIRRRAEAQEHDTLARFRAEAQQIIDRERTSIRQEVEAVRAPLRADAERLAADVVTKVLGRAA